MSVVTCKNFKMTSKPETTTISSESSSLISTSNTTEITTEKYQRLAKEYAKVIFVLFFCYNYCKFF